MKKTLHVLGLEVKVGLSGAETAGKYFIFEGMVTPGGGVPPHTHRCEDEIVKVLEGEIEVFLNGKTLTAKSGDICHFAQSISHGFTNKTHQTARLLFFVSPAANFEKFFEELDSLPPGPPDMHKVGEIFGRYKIDIDGVK